MTTNTNEQRLIERVLASKSEVVKLGVDLHARDVMVGVQLDGALPHRPQRMRAAQLVAIVGRLIQAGRRVYSCYEAGPCGYGLHRALLAAGAQNYVVVPAVLSDGRRQKTDQLDALALTERLDRYVRGHRKAFSVVNVPTEDQERARLQARLRGQLRHSRQQWEARGRSLLLSQGHHVTGAWWTARRWAELQPSLPAWLAEELAPMRTVLLTLEAQERVRRQALEATAPQGLPKMIGALTWVLLSREMRDWHRFKNRRQVASYTGLCPGVHQSGLHRREGSINRYGNARVRALLLELVWRLARGQPDYPPVRALVAGIARGAARRKCAVAAARKLAIDLWRLATGQTTPEKLHLSVPAGLAA